MNDLNLLPHEAERNPIVFARDGEVFANSREIAAYFDKRHDHVLRDIGSLISKEPNLGLHTFGDTPYTDPQNGQTYRSFDMTRDGFLLLAMGFTGARALKFKLSYIRAFNDMEAMVRQQAEQPVNLNDPAQLRALLLSYSDKAEKLQGQVDALLPKQEALDRIATADGSLCVTDAAKALQVRPTDLFKFLRDDRWIYRRVGTSHDVGFASKVGQGLLEHKITTVSRPDGTERISEQVRVTPKGLAKLSELMSGVRH